MVEKKIKKKKLTLSVSPKTLQNVSNYTHSKGKTSVVIEKKQPRRWGEKKFQQRENKPRLSEDNSPRKTPVNRNIDIRRLAEERATKRFKVTKDDVLHPKKSSSVKEKGSFSKQTNKC